MIDVRWDGYDHQQIYTFVQQGPGRAGSTAAEAVWTETEGLIARIDQRIASAMAQSASGWEGAAADTARAAMSPLGRWALDAANAARLTAQGVTAQGEQAANVRNAMPEPYAGAQMFGDVAGGLGMTVAGTVLFNPVNIIAGVGDLHAAATEAANREARARELMTAYTNASAENVRNLEFWTDPPQVTVERISDAGPGPGGGPGGPGAQPGPGSSVAPPSGPPGGPGPGVVPPPAGAVPPPPGGAGTPPPVVPPPATPPAVAPPSTPPVVPPPVVPPPPPPPSPLPGTPAPGVPDAGFVPPGGAVPGAGPGRRTPGAPGPTGPAGRPDLGNVPSGGRSGPGTAPPVVPGLPRNPPPPSWRDIIPSGPAGRPDVRSGQQDRPFPSTARPVEEPPVRPGPGAGPLGATPGGAVPGGSGPRSSIEGTAGLYPPMAGGAMSAQGRDRRRPDYLIDDTDAFADDRWFTPAVITPDDVPPPVRR